MRYKSLAVVLYVTDVEEAAVMKMYDWKPCYFKNSGIPCKKAMVWKDGFVYPIYAVRATGMGSVSSASMTSRAIATFRPQYVIMTGICGGVRFAHKKVQPKLGDVVVADSSWLISQGKYTTSEHGQVEAEKNIGFVPRPTTLSISLSLRENIKSLAKSYTDETRVHIGCYACGDSVIANKNMIYEKILPIMDHTKAVDMESYGVMYSVLKESELRTDPIIVKGISDFADKEKNDDFQQIAADNSCNFAKYLIKRLPLKEHSITAFLLSPFRVQKRSAQTDYAIGNRFFRFENILLSAALGAIIVLCSIFRLQEDGTVWHTLLNIATFAFLITGGFCVYSEKLPLSEKSLRNLYLACSFLLIYFICLITKHGIIFLALPMICSLAYLDSKFSVLAGYISFAIQMLTNVLIIYLSYIYGEYDAKEAVSQSIRIFTSIIFANVFLIHFIRTLGSDFENILAQTAERIVNKVHLTRDKSVFQLVKSERKHDLSAFEEESAPVFGLSSDNGSLSNDFFTFKTDKDSGITGICLGNAHDRSLGGSMMVEKIKAMAKSSDLKETGLTSFIKELNNLTTCNKGLRHSFSLFAGCLSDKEKVFSYISAGDFCFFIRRRDGVVYREDIPDRTFLGVDTEHIFEQKQICLNPSDTLFFVSSGLVKSARPNGEAFGEKRLMKILAGCASDSAIDVCLEVQYEYNRFLKHEPGTADYAMLAIRIPEEQD